jgi:hypothetical protein
MARRAVGVVGEKETWTALSRFGEKRCRHWSKRGDLHPRALVQRIKGGFSCPLTSRILTSGLGSSLQRFHCTKCSNNNNVLFLVGEGPRFRCYASMLFEHLCNCHPCHILNSHACTSTLLSIRDAKMVIRQVRAHISDDGRARFLAKGHR